MSAVTPDGATACLRSDPWLAVLLAGGNAGDVLTLREQLMAEADGEVERDLFAASADQAMRLAAALGERGQRAAELSTLYDLAIRLTGVRELDVLLQEVVTQGRRLLAVDLVYLALREDDGGMNIVVTDGSVGPHMRGTRLSLEGGLAGRVASTGEPFWTSDYLNETGITHAPDVDSAAVSESLASILGVPLRRGGEVVGVLMAAERDHRPFAPAEVSLLSSLAAIAAVAIDNAQLFAQLENTNRALREAHEATMRAVSHHDRLMSVASHGGEVDEVVAGVAEFIDGTVVYDAAVTEVPREPRETKAGGVTTTVVPVMAGVEVLGALRVESAAPPSETDQRLLERSALTIALLLSTRKALSEAEWRTADEALATLLNGSVTDPDVLLRRTSAAGLDLRKPTTVAVIPVAPTATGAILQRAKQFVATNGGLAGRFGAAVVVLTPRSGDEIAAAWNTPQRPRANCGLTGPVVGQPGIAAAYREAERTARALDALGRDGEISRPAELGPYRFLLSRAGRDDAAVFVRDQLGPLLVNDQERGTDLVATLHEFLASGRQHTATARAMSIHTNTLYQRLDRITAILGDDWREAARAFDLQMALRMHRLMEPGVFR